MRSLIVYIWLVTTILPTFCQWGTIAYYQLNREYIAKVLCQNRDKPQLHCNGKCYLAKKLKDQQDKQDQKTSELVKNTPSIQLFSSYSAHFELVARQFVFTRGHSFHYRLPAYQAPLRIVVQPPRA